MQRLHACRQRGLFLGCVAFVLFEPVEEASDKKKKIKRERLSLSEQVFAHKATARIKVFLLYKYVNSVRERRKTGSCCFGAHFGCFVGLCSMFT
jgi:hypothetical protein